MYIHNNTENIRRKLGAKNIAPLRQQIALLPKINDLQIRIDDMIYIDSARISDKTIAQIMQCALSLKPWRKGPFSLFGNNIESEWDSSIKFNLISNFLDIQGKEVADIGCNNGYYMFRMLSYKPQSLVGFDPSALYKCQFDFINHFIQSDIGFELLGLEDLCDYGKKFDTIICLGVLYHRISPIDSLKILKNALKKNGELILDTLIIDTPKPIALSPLSYAKMKNVYFIPSITTLENWLTRAGFKDMQIIAKKATDKNEQRKTSWIDTQSLEDFLDPNDKTKTIEGFQAPLRIYIKAK